MNLDDKYRIHNARDLEAIYGPAITTARQETDHLHKDFREFIVRAPFVILASGGRDGLSTSAKGDAGGFVKVPDPKTLLIPDRGANGRNDSLRNIVVNPHIALIFLNPGESEMVRVSGKAQLSIDPDLLALFAGEGKPARCVIVVQVEEALLQCSRAIQKSGLWSSNRE